MLVIDPPSASQTIRNHIKQIQPVIGAPDIASWAIVLYYPLGQSRSWDPNRIASNHDENVSFRRRIRELHISLHKTKELNHAR